MQTKDSTFGTFPGGHKGNPWAWDYIEGESWQAYVASEEGSLGLFNATRDQHVFIYPNLWPDNARQYTTGQRPGQLLLRLAAKKLTGFDVMGWQFYFGDKVNGRQAELPTFDKLVIRARTTNAAPVQAKVTLITDDAAGYAANIALNNTLQEIEIPLSSLKSSTLMLLPRPYPSFHPYWFKPGKVEAFNLNQAEKFEITIGEGLSPAEKDKPLSFEVESVWLEKSE